MKSTTLKEFLSLITKKEEDKDLKVGEALNIMVRNEACVNKYFLIFATLVSKMKIRKNMYYFFYAVTPVTKKDIYIMADKNKLPVLEPADDFSTKKCPVYALTRRLKVFDKNTILNIGRFYGIEIEDETMNTEQLFEEIQRKLTFRTKEGNAARSVLNIGSDPNPQGGVIILPSNVIPLDAFIENKGRWVYYSVSKFGYLESATAFIYIREFIRPKERQSAGFKLLKYKLSSSTSTNYYNY